MYFETIRGPHSVDHDMLTCYGHVFQEQLLYRDLTGDTAAGSTALVVGAQYPGRVCLGTCENSYRPPILDSEFDMTLFSMFCWSRSIEGNCRFVIASDKCPLPRVCFAIALYTWPISEIAELSGHFVQTSVLRLRGENPPNSLLPKRSKKKVRIQ